jgi:hypothetical protein
MFSVCSSGVVWFPVSCFFHVHCILISYFVGLVSLLHCQLWLLSVQSPPIYGVTRFHFRYHWGKWCCQLSIDFSCWSLTCPVYWGHLQLVCAFDLFRGQSWLLGLRCEVLLLWDACLWQVGRLLCRSFSQLRRTLRGPMYAFGCNFVPRVASPIWAVLQLVPGCVIPEARVPLSLIW